MDAFYNDIKSNTKIKELIIIIYEIISNYNPLINWLKKLLWIFIFENSIFQILYSESNKFHLRSFYINKIDNLFKRFIFDDNIGEKH